MLGKFSTTGPHTRLFGDSFGSCFCFRGGSYSDGQDSLEGTVLFRLALDSPDPGAPTLHVAGLQICTTMPSSVIFIF